MFEKSLYDLIRGLRNHKGNERAYIQDSIRECRREIKTQDMDLKATALLKLTYLEMFGHDMSWASFNVLEVMSSQKYPQKRVAYLAAVQSFRPDTEVLVLMENQLKKDLGSPLAPTISLPLVAIPHVLNMSMANSLLADLLPRLSHSNSIIRKKTIVTLYRLALVYPETLRPTWPKMKERLQDESEDPSVTAAVVNVVCELGWRRPQDFLPLAPRLFDLLVEGNNNWMAIKIIKLFAILTPLEPRLVKKLVSPLTSIIRTTPAMSLLYEAINGIINGGIFTSAGETTEGDELARLCVNKLRGMLAIEGDPNLRYVALLALERIIEVHPYLVSMHEDAILACVDDRDISIRLRALDLATGMVNARNLNVIVDRLMRELESHSVATHVDDVQNDRAFSNGVVPSADSDDDNATQPVRPQPISKDDANMPEEYRVTVIEKIVGMCSYNNYANISDFDWYITTLLALFRHVPAASSTIITSSGTDSSKIALALGHELQNVAVRVRSSRAEAVKAAETHIMKTSGTSLSSSRTSAHSKVLGPCTWMVGEFADDLLSPESCLDALVRIDSAVLPSETLKVAVQAVVKVFAQITSDADRGWSPERKTMMTLLMSKLIAYLSGLITHPDLEIQEASIAFLELLRLANEATTEQASSQDDGYNDQVPLLLSQAIPSLFIGAELNPVAPDAQSRVPIPEEMNLGEPINEYLNTLLHVVDSSEGVRGDKDFEEYYYTRPQPQQTFVQPAANRLYDPEPVSYQSAGSQAVDVASVTKRKGQQQTYTQDDPFYLSGRTESGTATPIHEILRSNNGNELDIDSIPIMELDLGESGDASTPQQQYDTSSAKPQQSKKKKIDILLDESIDQPANGGRPSTPLESANGIGVQDKARHTFLQVDSSGLGSLSLEEASGPQSRRSPLDIERLEAEELEMAQAMKEVERLRLEMQRAQERIETKSESTVLKKKNPKKQRLADGDDSGAPGAESLHDTRGDADHSADPGLDTTAQVVKRKKKKKAAAVDPDAEQLETEDPRTARKKKKKRREVEF